VITKGQTSWIFKEQQITFSLNDMKVSQVNADIFL
jgi:hypothetical protein